MLRQGKLLWRKESQRNHSRTPHNGITRMELMAHGDSGMTQLRLKDVCFRIELHSFKIAFVFLSDRLVWTVKWFNCQPNDTLCVIIYLMKRDELSDLNISLVSLRQYLFKPRPIVIFHEGDLDDADTQNSLAKILGPNIPLGFEQIRFPTTVWFSTCVLVDSRL